jgi:hypothetical protein
MIASKNEEILADPLVFQEDQRQDDESFANLDPCEGQWLIEDHKKLSLGKYHLVMILTMEMIL